MTKSVSNPRSALESHSTPAVGLTGVTLMSDIARTELATLRGSLLAPCRGRVRRQQLLRPQSIHRRAVDRTAEAVLNAELVVDVVHGFEEPAYRVDPRVQVQAQHTGTRNLRR